MSTFPKSGEIFSRRYELLEVLGEGGIGTVFKALQIDVDRTIALKILHPNFAADEEFKKRFVREAKALSQLSHSGIVNVYHIGVSETGLPYMAMELIEGESLRAVLHSQGRLPLLRAVKIVRQAAGALSLVHEHGVVHRDLKPENIVLLDKPEVDTVKLIDFGLALFEAEQRLTGTGILIGSVSYMSPEQCRGLRADNRADVYALSVCFFEMITGSRPFAADNPVGVIYKHLNDSIPQLSREQVDRYDPCLNEFFKRGLAKEPEQRFACMRDLIESLDELAETVEQNPPTTGSPSRSPVFRLSDVLSRKSLMVLLPFFFLMLVFVPIRQEILRRSLKEKAALTPSPGAAASGSPSVQRRVTLSGAVAIIKQSSRVAEKDFSAAPKFLDAYLSSNKLEDRARCLLLLRRANYAAILPEKTKFTEQAYRISEKELKHNKDRDSMDIFLSSALDYANNLYEAKRSPDSLSVCRNARAVLSADADSRIGKSMFIGDLSLADKTDFLILEAKVYFQQGEAGRANSIADQIRSCGYGGFRQADAVVPLLLSLGRVQDIYDYIHVLATGYEGDRDMPIYHYDAVMNFEALCKVAALCTGASQWKAAEDALARAAKIDELAFSQLPGGIKGTIHLGVERARLYFAKGEESRGKKVLIDLADSWLDANLEEQKPKDAKFQKLNPLELIPVLLQHKLNPQAHAIISRMSRSVSDYAPELTPQYGIDGRFESNRNIIIEQLSPYRDDKNVQSFIDRLKALSRTSTSKS